MKNYISEAEKYVKNKGWIESTAIDKACQTKCSLVTAKERTFECNKSVG